MDLAIQQEISLNFSQKLQKLSNLCKISNIEKLLSDCIENMPTQSPIDYIGELNKNDIMH